MQLLKKHIYYFLTILIMLVIVLMLLVHTFNHTTISSNDLIKEETKYPSGC